MKILREPLRAKVLKASSERGISVARKTFRHFPDAVSSCANCLKIRGDLLALI